MIVGVQIHAQGGLTMVRRILAGGGILVLSVGLLASALGEECGAPCDSACQKIFFFWKPHQRPHGRPCTPCPPRGTECSCGPQGGFFGYFPTCWSRWPQEWQPCPPLDWADYSMPATAGESVLPKPPLPAAPGEPLPVPTRVERLRLSGKTLRAALDAPLDRVSA